MKQARSMSPEKDSDSTIPKMVDLLSRNNCGVVQIQPFQDSANRVDRRADKVCIAVALFKRRLGSKLDEIPLSLRGWFQRQDSDTE